MLMQISPVIAELGGNPLRVDYIDGYAEYMAGEPVLSGIRILGDSQIMITIRHEFLPFFYELGLLDCLPYPIQVIAPGCEVKDDGQGAYIDGLYFCPHHPDKGFEGERPEYKRGCDCRKPKAGLVLQAAKDFNIDLSASYMIGDRDKDVECGKAAGLRQSLLCERNGNLLEALEKLEL